MEFVKRNIWAFVVGALFIMIVSVLGELVKDEEVTKLDIEASYFDFGQYVATHVDTVPVHAFRINDKITIVQMDNPLVLGLTVEQLREQYGESYLGITDGYSRPKDNIVSWVNWYFKE